MQYYKFKIYALFVSFFTGRSKIILLRYLVIDEDNSEIIIVKISCAGPSVTKTGHMDQHFKSSVKSTKKVALR